MAGARRGLAFAPMTATGGLVSGLHDSLLLCVAVALAVVALAPGLRPAR